MPTPKTPDSDQPTSNMPNLDITVDYERYAHLLDDPTLTDEQKQQFLQAMWDIICNFVALGFRVHPVQAFDKPCGQDGSATDEPPKDAENQSAENERIPSHDPV